MRELISAEVVAVAGGNDLGTLVIGASTAGGFWNADAYFGSLAACNYVTNGDMVRSGAVPTGAEDAGFAAGCTVVAVYDALTTRPGRDFDFPEGYKDPGGN